jgi:thiamine biosynthesis lipoprotein
VLSNSLRTAIWATSLGLVLSAAGTVPTVAAAPPPAPPIAAASDPARGFYVTRTSTAMGTFLQVRLYFDRPAAEHTAELEAAAGAQIDRSFAEIRRLEALMTTWRDDSDVSRINRAAGGAAVVVSPEVFEVVERSVEYSKLSGGAFDITFYGLKGLWHFDDDLRPELPDPAELRRRLPLVNWRKLYVDRAHHSVRLGKPGMAINLGGIGKGYAVDAAVRLLKAAGYADGMVQAGGDLMLFGSKHGQPFMAGVRDPRSADPQDYFAVCPVLDHAFSTAGDYERSFIREGRRYHHILDPRTGYPATAARSVTIFAKDATTADGLDDAVLILGAERGLALIESIADAGAIIVDGDNRVHVSKRLTDRVRIVHPPSPGL